LGHIFNMNGFFAHVHPYELHARLLSTLLLSLKVPGTSSTEMHHVRSAVRRHITP
jgi:hypothetical protein